MSANLFRNGLPNTLLNVGAVLGLRWLGLGEAPRYLRRRVWRRLRNGGAWSITDGIGTEAAAA